MCITTPLETVIHITSMIDCNHGNSFVSVYPLQGLTLDPSADSMNLEYMVTMLEIPSAPKLKALAADFTLVSHIWEPLLLQYSLS